MSDTKTERPRRKRRLWRRLLIVLLVLGLPAVSSWSCMIRMPGESYRGPLPPLDEQQRQLAERLRSDLQTLSADIGERHTARYDNLLRAEAFLTKSLQEQGYTVARQEFEAAGKTCANLEIELRGTKTPDQIVVIGAHYDTVPNSPGADDNGSGAVAVLALARHFAGRRTDRTLRFVLFVNEEAPYFQTHLMGSMVYARRCARRQENVVGMFSLEMLGHYTDETASQQYPFPFSMFYPSTGNFVGFVGNVSSRDLVRQAVASFRAHAKFPSEGAAVPGSIEGVGFSDHWSFWQHDYPALMVTDTAFFRYAHYHQPTDTVDQLDFQRMARVVDGLKHVVEDLARTP